MWIVGPVGFAAPLALAALAALPLALWLLRATPPPPRRVSFPPVRLLLALRDPEETPERTPWWLVALRLTIAALVIGAAARPLLSPTRTEAPFGTLVLAVDDGWAAAANWSRLTAAAETELARAEAAGASVRLLFTAPGADGRLGVFDTDAAGARARLRAHAPKPWSVDRRRAAGAVGGPDPVGDGPVRVVWLSDGLEDGGSRRLASGLERLGPLRAVAAGPPPLAIADARATAGGLEVAFRRPNGLDVSRHLDVEDEAGRRLARTPFRLARGQRRATVVVAADWSVLNRAAVVRVAGVESAGAVRVLSGGARRPVVGVVGEPLARGRPLGSGAWYVARALSPTADVREGPPAAVLAARPDALVLPGGPLAGADADAAAAYVRAGGVLIRFADARLLAQPDALLPAPLAERPRALDGALTWARPQGLAAGTAGPLVGLTPPADARVRRQAVFREASTPGVQVWASLADGSPVVSAARSGEGWIMLVHVAAIPGGSDLPLTGAFPEMLTRLARLALPLESEAAAGPWRPVRLLDGFGRWREPEAADASAPDLETAPGPGRAPGLYAAGTVRGALNVLAPGAVQTPLAVATQQATEAQAPPRPLGGVLLLLALALLAVDLLAARRLLRPAAALAAAALAVAPAAARAQSPADLAAETRLAYVATGDPAVDGASRSGLEALTEALRRRTAVAPGAPVAVDPARAPLSLYPALYWPVTPGASLSPVAAGRLAAYLRGGGVILFDTRDDGAPQPATREALRRVLGGLDPPPLRVVNRDHVLSRAFYLLDGYGGRRADARVWAATADGESVDGVSPVLTGGGDWAAGWAGQGVGPQGRELALRFGVNWVLYALTGTYKTDQVHVPALLQRLERDRR